MKKLLTIAFAAFIFSSCSKQIENISAPIQHISGNNQEAINQSLDNAASIIATALKNKDVRAFIKTEALKQFDGDFDILYNPNKNIVIGGRSFENILSEATQGKFAEAKSFSNLVANIPNFQISVPVHCQEWDENYIPYVAISELGVNEKEHKPIKAYDMNGNVHMLNSKSNPTMPVVVVGISERVDESGRLKYNFESAATSLARSNGQNTILGTMKCPSLSGIESWANGKPELRLRIYSAKLTSGSLKPTSNKITEKYYNPARGDIDNKWYTVNTSLYNWYRYWTPPTTNFVYGSDAIFAWVEEDGGTVVNVNVGISGTIGASSGANLNVSLSASFTLQDNDENLGDANVYYSDPTLNNVYSTGTIDFELD